MKTSIHPAPFPIELPLNCIKACTDETDTVLDPFMGSGTTALACEQLKRNWIGIEISKKYCDMTISMVKGLKERGK